MDKLGALTCPAEISSLCCCESQVWLSLLGLFSLPGFPLGISVLPYRPEVEESNIEGASLNQNKAD